MKSEGNQIDFVSQQQLIRAHRIAAEAALTPPYFSEPERKSRHDHHVGEAERLEAAL